MNLAMEEARAAAAEGEVPVGAVVVYAPYDPATRAPLASPRVIAKAHNMREMRKDASAHAEFLALQQAMCELDAWRLTGCHVYVTLEPCVMCAGLMQQARIERCVFGAYDKKGGALGTLFAIHEDARLNHSFEAMGGVDEEACAALLKKFFQERRGK